MIDSNIGIDTLGMLLAPNESMNEEFQYLLKKSMTWAYSIY